MMGGGHRIGGGSWAEGWNWRESWTSAMDARRAAGIVPTQCGRGKKSLNSGSQHKRGNQRRAPSHSAYIKGYSLCRGGVSPGVDGGGWVCVCVEGWGGDWGMLGRVPWPPVRPPTAVAIPQGVCLHKSHQACSCSISGQQETVCTALHCTALAAGRRLLVLLSRRGKWWAWLIAVCRFRWTLHRGCGFLRLLQLTHVEVYQGEPLKRQRACLPAGGRGRPAWDTPVVLNCWSLRTRSEFHHHDGAKFNPQN